MWFSPFALQSTIMERPNKHGSQTPTAPQIPFSAPVVLAGNCSNDKQPRYKLDNFCDADLPRKFQACAARCDRVRRKRTSNSWPYAE